MFGVAGQGGQAGCGGVRGKLGPGRIWDLAQVQHAVWDTLAGQSYLLGYYCLICGLFLCVFYFYCKKIQVMPNYTGPGAGTGAVRLLWARRRCGELQAARGARGARFIYQRLPSRLASSVTGAKSPVIMQRRKLLS